MYVGDLSIGSGICFRNKFYTVVDRTVSHTIICDESMREFAISHFTLVQVLEVCHEGG